jgi:hypothetical protein
VALENPRIATFAPEDYRGDGRASDAIRLLYWRTAKWPIDAKVAPISASMLTFVIVAMPRLDCIGVESAHGSVGEDDPPLCERPAGADTSAGEFAGRSLSAADIGYPGRFQNRSLKV